MKKNILVLIFIIISGVVFAQTQNENVQENKSEVKVLTIDEAVDYALKNSRSLKSSAIDLEIKKRASTFSWNTLLPGLSVSASGSRSNDYGGTAAAFSQITATLMAAQGIPVQPQTDFANEKERWAGVGVASLSWNFNLAMIDAIKAAHLQYENQLISWDQTLRQTEVNIRKLFYGILLMQENLNIQKTNLNNANARYEQALADYNNGIVPELSVLNSQVSYENLKPNVISMEQQITQQKNTFAFLLGLPFGTKLDLSGSIDVNFVSVDANDLVEKYCAQCQEILSLKNTIRMLETSLNANFLSTFTPTFSLSWGFQPVIYTYDSKDEKNSWKNPFADDTYDSGSLSLTIVFPNIINMLPFSSNYQKIKDTKAQLQQMNIALEQLMQNSEIQVHTYVDNLTKSELNIKAMKNNVLLAEKAYNSTLSSYNDGGQDLLAVKDAENSMNQAKLGLMNEKFNYISTLLDLEYMLNISILEK
jgi:outer membrane protein TolC